MRIETLLESTNSKLEAEIILADLLGKDRSFIYAHPEFELSKNQTLQFITRLKRREKNEPLAYILGYKEFYGLKFLVDNRVLIPRPETENLVDQVLKFATNKYRRKQIKIADLGTGSGCIAITLAKHLPNAEIYAIDAAKNALEVANKNALLHSVSDKIKFLLGDLLSTLPEKVDTVVANLPYVKSAVIEKLDPQISKWEPKIALDGGKDGMELYRRLFIQAKNYLNTGEIIFYEVDGEVKTLKP